MDKKIRQNNSSAQLQQSGRNAQNYFMGGIVSRAANAMLASEFFRMMKDERGALFPDNCQKQKMEAVGVILKTTGGDFALNPKDAAIIFTGESAASQKDVTRKSAIDVNDGDMVLGDPTQLSMPFEKFEVSLNKSPQFMASVASLFELGKNGKRVTRLRCELIRGLSRFGIVSPDAIEDKIHFQTDDFEHSDYRTMSKWLHRKITESNKAGKTPMRDVRTARDWLKGETIAPGDISLFSVLAELSRFFKDISEGKSDFSERYEYYVNLKSFLMNYIGIIKQGRARGLREILDKFEAEVEHNENCDEREQGKIANAENGASSRKKRHMKYRDEIEECVKQHLLLLDKNVCAMKVLSKEVVYAPISYANGKCKSKSQAQKEQREKNGKHPRILPSIPTNPDSALREKPMAEIYDELLVFEHLFQNMLLDCLARKESNQFISLASERQSAMKSGSALAMDVLMTYYHLLGMRGVGIASEKAKQFCENNRYEKSFKDTEALAAQMYCAIENGSIDAELGIRKHFMRDVLTQLCRCENAMPTHYRDTLELLAEFKHAGDMRKEDIGSGIKTSGITRDDMRRLERDLDKSARKLKSEYKIDVLTGGKTFYTFLASLDIEELAITMNARKGNMVCLEAAKQAKDMDGIRAYTRAETEAILGQYGFSEGMKFIPSLDFFFEKKD